MAPLDVSPESPADLLKGRHLRLKERMTVCVSPIPLGAPRLMGRDVKGRFVGLFHGAGKRRAPPLRSAALVSTAQAGRILGH